MVTSDKEDDDDFDLPSIEQLLYTTLHKESFAAEDQPLNNAVFKVGNRTTNERDGSLDDNGSAPGGKPSLSRSPGEHTVYSLSWKQTTPFSNMAQEIQVFC
jgi:hypothetical protein